MNAQLEALQSLRSAFEVYPMWSTGLIYTAALALAVASTVQWLAWRWSPTVAGACVGLAVVLFGTTLTWERNHPGKGIVSKFLYGHHTANITRTHTALR